MSALGMSDIDELVCREPTATLIETLDHIPLVSIISGLARSIFGALEALFGLFALPFQLASRTVSSKPNPLYLVDGIANIIRGLIAMEPIVGNLTLYVYDHTRVIKSDIQHAAGLAI